MKRIATVQRRLRVLLAAIALVLLSAAGAAASQAGFVYALHVDNGKPNQIFGYRLDPLTAVLVPLPGFPIASGGTGFSNLGTEQMAYANGRLYVLTGGNRISVFTVNASTGALTHLPFSPFSIGGSFWGCVAVHPSGSPVVVGNQFGELASFVVTPTTITAAPGSPFATGADAKVVSCAFSRDGNFVYAGGWSGSSIAGFSVNAGTGVLTPLPGSPFVAGVHGSLFGGTFPRGYATDSMGRLFTASLWTVEAFTTVGGVPTGVAGNPFPSGMSFAWQGVLHPSGFYIVAGGFLNQVGVYQISGSGSGTTLSAVSGSPFAAHGGFTNGLALTVNGLLVVANGDSRNLEVFQVNATTGTLISRFVQAHHALGVTGQLTGLAFAPGSIPGDFDGDARSDLLWRNTVTGQNIGWLMNGATVASAVSLPTIADTNWEVRGRGDFNGDRKSDVLWRNSATGQNIIWLMNGLTVSMAASLPGIHPRWEIQGVGDVNADGKADIFWRNKMTGQNSGWLMNGTALSSSSAVQPTIADTNWEIAGVGDFNRDANADVIWRHNATGENVVWLMHGLVVRDEVGLPAMTDTNWEIQGVGDFDASGKSDIIWRHKEDGQNLLWLMNGAVVNFEADLPTIEDPNWEIQFVGDMNVDFKADVIWRNKKTGQNIQWLMNGLTVATATLLPTIADTNWKIVGR